MLFLNKLMNSLLMTDKMHKLRHTVCLNHPDVYFVTGQHFLIHTPESQISLQWWGRRFLDQAEKSRFAGIEEAYLLSFPQSSWSPSEPAHHRIVLIEKNSLPDAPILGIRHILQRRDCRETQ